MAEPVKFTDEEIKELQEVQNKYFNVQGDLGRVSITRIRLTQQLATLDEKASSLEAEFLEVQKEEKGFIDKINEKYGDGVLDPETGTFTPASKK